MKTYKTLSNGTKIPVLGFGTDLIPEGETIINAVTWAIESGYRHIDNADCYRNETGVGIAIHNCIKRGIVKREDLFLINKVPDWKQGYDATIKCCEESLKRVGVDYFDLYLVHSPLRQYNDWRHWVLDTYRAIETLYERGLVKNIGVSNFEVRHMEFILNEAKIKPVVNQIELHPMHQQKNVVRFCEKNNVALIGWGTLNQGRIFKNQTFLEMAKKYNKDVGQIAVRWSLQKGHIPLARSTKKDRIASNFDVMNFELSDQDMKILDGMDGGEFSNWHHDGLKPDVMIPASQIFKRYKKVYKLFGFVPLWKINEYKQNKTKYYLFGFIPILKMTKKVK